MIYAGNDLKYLNAREDIEGMEMEALCDHVRLKA